MDVTPRPVTFTRMQDGSPEKFATVKAAERAQKKLLPGRIIQALEAVADEGHPVFPMYHYAHFIGGDRNARERYRGHQWFDDAAYFCENYDENCFDPDYNWLPMEHFAPMLHEVFGCEPVFG